MNHIIRDAYSNVAYQSATLLYASRIMWFISIPVYRWWYPRIDHCSIEFSHNKLMSMIQPEVTQVLKSPKENRTNKYSTYHDEEHATAKHHTHADIRSTTTHAVADQVMRMFAVVSILCEVRLRIISSRNTLTHSPHEIVTSMTKATTSTGSDDSNEGTVRGAWILLESARVTRLGRISHPDYTRLRNLKLTNEPTSNLVLVETLVFWATNITE